MLNEKASVVRVYGEDDAIIGKCSICQRRIENDNEKFWCKETRMINTKCFCGGCLLDLKSITDKVFDAYEIEKMKYQNDVIPTFYSIDEATGRIVVE
jgi:hypothetical protein